MKSTQIANSPDPGDPDLGFLERGFTDIDQKN